MKLPKTRNYIVIKNNSELAPAMKNPICRFIIQERSNSIFLWRKLGREWKFYKFSFFGESVASEDGTSGFLSYQSFYNYCGREEIEKMKKVFPNIEKWESEEQLHYYNPKYSGELLKGKFFELDVNSSFSYGVMQLPSDFIKLKEYMMILYDKKKTAKTKQTRTKYKNMQNFLIGYFFRIKDFVSLRSKIIENSNNAVLDKISEIVENGGHVYLSNTDSIITDEIGYFVMKRYIGEKVGELKLELVSNKLYYESSNCYQIGDKLVYSGVKYFARQHTDLFKKQTATQSGELVRAYDLEIDPLIEDFNNIGKIKESKIIVNVYNSLGEKINEVIYKIDLGDLDI